MIRFVPASQGELLTRALWRLAVPSPLPGATDKAFDVFEDILDGTKWLAVDTEFTIRVHEDAELDGIADILQPWIDDGVLPLDTNSSLTTLIESSKGTTLKLYDAFPAFFKASSLTQEQMISSKRLAGSAVNP